MKLKERLVSANHFSCKKLKGTVCAFKLVAFKFQILHLFNKLCNSWIRLLHCRINLLNFFHDCRTACNFAHKEHAFVTNSFRRNMFISFRIFQNSINVHSSLMTESSTTNKRKSVIQSDICNLCNALSDWSKLLDFFIINTLKAHLKLKVRNDT